MTSADVRLDQSTISTYNANAQAFAEDWETQPPPSDLHEAVKRYFKPGRTADIGCGSGRDTAWLCENGFPAVGYDASAALLEEARSRHPGISFNRTSLPGLIGVERNRFTNVLCETVIMHLPKAGIADAVGELLALLVPGGTLYLSWRVTVGDDLRDDHERLYSAFNPQMVLEAVEGTEILLNEQIVSASSKKLIHRLVFRR